MIKWVPLWRHFYHALRLAILFLFPEFFGTPLDFTSFPELLGFFTLTLYVFIVEQDNMYFVLFYTMS